MTDETNVDILLEGLDEDDIGSLLRIYNDVNKVQKAIKEKVEMLRDKIKIALKERKWDSYMDEDSKISVSITSQSRESVNKKALKILVNEEQYNQIVTKTSHERMLVVTPKDRERLKKYGKK